MARPWTLPGSITNRKEKLEVADRTPSIYDFNQINEAMERIKKEEVDTNGIDISKKDDSHLGEDRPFYPSYYGKSDGSALSFYEHMELLLDENDQLISKYFPDPRIQQLIEKYGLKVENESLQKYGNPPNRILP